MLIDTSTVGAPCVLSAGTEQAGACFARWATGAWHETYGAYYTGGDQDAAEPKIVECSHFELCIDLTVHY